MYVLSTVYVTFLDVYLLLYEYAVGYIEAVTIDSRLRVSLPVAVGRNFHFSIRT